MNRNILGILIVVGMVAIFSGGWLVGHSNPIVVQESLNSSAINAIKLGAVSNYTDNIDNAQVVDALYSCPFNESVALEVALIRPVAAEWHYREL